MGCQGAILPCLDLSSYLSQTPSHLRKLSTMLPFTNTFFPLWSRPLTESKASPSERGQQHDYTEHIHTAALHLSVHHLVLRKPYFGAFDQKSILTIVRSWARIWAYVAYRAHQLSDKSNGFIKEEMLSLDKALCKLLSDS